MNLFLRELKAYRGSMLTWIVSLCGLALMFMALYPAFSADVDALESMLANFPEAIRSALNLELATFFSVLGFYSYLLSFAILAAAIQAMNLGTGVISKESAGKTVDFLLTKPVTRTRVVTAKLAAVLVVLLATNAAFVAVSLGAVSAVGEEFDMGTLLLLASTMLLVQLAFLALGILFSVTIPKIKSVVAVSLPTVFAFYIIGVIGDVVGTEEARYVSPFRFYDPNLVLKDGSLETKFLIIEAVFVVVAIAASYVIYQKKDIRAAI